MGEKFTVTGLTLRIKKMQDDYNHAMSVRTKIRKTIKLIQYNFGEKEIDVLLDLKLKSRTRSGTYGNAIRRVERRNKQ